MQLANNTELQGGKYRIVRVLGQGGFGITYLAQDRRKRKVAIKEFFPNGMASRDLDTHFVSMQAERIVKLKKKFLLEAAKIRQLNHPNVIKALDVFEENGTAYYVMEYIDGKSLSDIIDTKLLTEKEQISIIYKMCQALEHIHAHRMLHLDIKPVNIMVRNTDNEPVLIDFGISKTYDEEGNPNTTLLGAASLGYSPIEQRLGDLNSFSPATDIFALGATCYKVITRNNPPIHPTPQMAERLIFDSYTSSALQNIIRKAMQYDKANRYQTVKAMLNDLAKLAPLKADSKQSMPEQLSLKKLRVVNQPPYFVGDTLAIRWQCSECDAIYVNGHKFDVNKRTKKITYDTPGKKKVTVKVVKGDKSISDSISFEVISPENQAAQQNIGNIVDAIRQQKQSKSEETQIIHPEIVETQEKPRVISFATSQSATKRHVGDSVFVYWQVEGANRIIVNGREMPNSVSSTYIKITNQGKNTITLRAYNDNGFTTARIEIDATFKSQVPPKSSQDPNKFQSKNIDADNNGSYWLYAIITSCVINFFWFDVAQSTDPYDKFMKGLIGYIFFVILCTIIIKPILVWLHKCISSK